MTAGENARVRVDEAAESDVAAIAEIHLAAFPQQALSLLGVHGVRDYYRLLMASDVTLLLVARESGHPVGFAAGTTQPAQLYRALLTRVVARRPLHVIGSLVRNPRTIAHAAGRVARRSVARRPTPARGPARHGTDVSDHTTAELSSLATGTTHTGRGVGSQLLASFEEQCRTRGSRAVCLYTYSEPSQTPVVEFYRHRGYAVVTAGDRSGGSGRLRLMKELS